MKTSPRGPWAVALGALALSAIARMGYCATLPATPATLGATVAKAQAGDTVTLAAGAYGDVYLSRKAPAAITIGCADPAARPNLRSLTLSASSYLTLTCLDVAFTPDAKTVTWSSAVQVNGSDHIRFAGVRILGGKAVSGVPETATALDGTGNVIGWPTARGMTISASSDVALDQVEVAAFHKGVVILGSQRVAITRSDLHDMRTTAIVGSNLSDITIDSNALHDASPWAWGKQLVDPVSGKLLATYGDHADFVAFWSDSGQATPNARIRITNNTFRGLDLSGGKGGSTGGVQGSWLQGSVAAPFMDAVYSGNTFALANLQAISLWNVKGGSIDHNTFLRTGDDEKSAPTIQLRGGISGLAVTGNQLAAPVDDQSAGGAVVSANTLLTGAMNLAVKPPAPGPAADPRDAKIADLSAQLVAAEAAAKDARERLAAATAQVGVLQGQVTAGDMALKVANDALAALKTRIASAVALLQPGP